MLLFAGLGNPGPGYAGNRHNIGFRVVDAIHARYRFAPWRKRFQGYVATGDLGGEEVLLLKPQTLMNESGVSVAKASSSCGIPLNKVVVFHDDLQIELGTVRTKIGGGLAGHNGLRSITALCGNDYMRVQLGIGHPGEKRLVHQYVLSDFFMEERPLVEQVIESVAFAAEFIATDQLKEFHLALHSRGIESRPSIPPI